MDNKKIENTIKDLLPKCDYVNCEKPAEYNGSYVWRCRYHYTQAPEELRKGLRRIITHQNAVDTIMQLKKERKEDEKM